MTQVGLWPAKQLVQQLLADAVGRAATAEPQHRRHMLISGGFGTGKRTAAELLGTAAIVLGAADQPPLPDGVISTDGDSALVEIENFTELRPPPSGSGIEPRTVYYVREPRRPSDGDEGQLLEKLVAKDSFIIVGGSASCVDGFRALQCLKKADRARWLELPTLTVGQLAQITVQRVEGAGYRLQRHGGGSAAAPAGLDAAVMEYIIRMTYDDQRAIAEGAQAPTPACPVPPCSSQRPLVDPKLTVSAPAAANGHLADDMLQRAISRKNSRILSGQLAASPSGSSASSALVLTPKDFGVAHRTAEELSAVRAAAADRAAELYSRPLTGPPPIPPGAAQLLAAAAMRPADFFSTRLPAALADGDGGPKPDHLHVLVTGRSGSGRRAYAELYCQHLHGQGVLSEPTLVVTNVAAARGGGDGPTTELLDSKAGGVLYVRLGPGVDDWKPADVAAVHELLSAAEGRHVVVVLAGAEPAATKLVVAEPGLGLQLRWQVSLPDLGPEALAEIAERHAEAAKGCSFEPGLASKLAAHLADHFDDLGAAGNARLAQTLVERADRRREERVFRSFQAADPPASPASPGKAKDLATVVDPRQLLIADFALSNKLVTGHLKDAIDRELGDLIGMAVAKEFFEQAKAKVKYVEQTGDRTALKTCLNLVLTGNPVKHTQFAMGLGIYGHDF